MVFYFILANRRCFLLSFHKLLLPTNLLKTRSLKIVSAHIQRLEVRIEALEDKQTDFDRYFDRVIEEVQRPESSKAME